MKRRVFICSTGVFPRGSASANYIQYLAMALLETNCEVVVISFGDYKKCDYDKAKDRYVYKSIIFDRINVRKSKIGHWVDMHHRLGYIIIKKLLNYSPTSQDVIITYSTDKTILLPLLAYARKQGIKTAACVVEYFSDTDFKHSFLGRKYKDYLKMFTDILPRFDLTFPISHYLENYLLSLGCKTFCLPIMADPYEYSNMPRVQDGISRMLFIAYGRVKDSYETVVKALEYLPEELFTNLEIHFKGITQAQLKCDLNSRLLKYLGSRIICHGWMEYNDLIELYRRTDFLILARETNQMTLANFPSKVPEVMSYGVIPIVSDVGDYTAYYLKDGVDSIYIKECNAESCAKAIKKALYLNEKERNTMSGKAINTVHNKFYYKVWKDKIYQALFG